MIHESKGVHIPFLSSHVPCGGCISSGDTLRYVRITVGEKSIQLITQSERFAECVESEMVSLCDESLPPSHADVTIILCDKPFCICPPRLDQAQNLFSSNRVTIHCCEENFVTCLSEGKRIGFAEMSVATRLGRVWCDPLQPKCMRELLHCALTDALLVLISDGILPLHAAVVSRDESAVMLLGESNSGKTTTALRFLQHGYRVVSDDRACLVVRGKTVKVCGLPSTLRVRPEMLKSCPDVLEMLPVDYVLEPPPSGEHKYRLHIPISAGVECTVSHILFCKVRWGCPTRIERLATSNAFLLLMQQITRLPQLKHLRSRAVDRYFHAVNALVSGALCYNAFLGHDAHRIVEMLR